MKKYYSLTIMLGFSIVLHAQKVEKLVLTSNPSLQNLTQKGEVNSSKSILKIFNYDNNKILTGIGISNAAYSIGTLIELPNSTLQPYIGKTIDYIRFGIDNSTIISSAQIVIYEDKLEGTPAFTQTIEAYSITSGYNQIKLDEGYTLKEGKTLFIGVIIETDAGGYTLTYDTDAASQPNLSGHTLLNGTYYGTLYTEIGIDADYNIQALITDGLGADYKDLAIIDIKPSTEGCSFSSSELLKVTFLNKGEDSISTQFNLTASINGIEVLQQVTPTVFYPNIEKIINLPAVDMSAYGSYQITGSFDYTDSKPENNAYSSTILSGDAVLRIDLLTDAIPEETSWKLVDQLGNIVIENEPYEAETEYSTELCIISSNCYSLVISDTYGDGIECDSAFTVYYNDSLIAISPENGNFGYEFKVLGIANGCFKNDIQLTHIELPLYEAPQTLPIKGTIYNNGTDTIKIFDVVYTIDNLESSVYTISGISIPIGKTYNFTHDVPFNFEEEKAYQIEVSVLNPNSNADEYVDDNLMIHKLVINSQVQPKRQLIEHFTSSTNDECFNFTPMLDEMLASNFENYSLIRYQTNWPEPGDPYYIDQTGARVNYYNVNSLPSVYRNGTYDSDITQDVFDAYANQKTILSLDAIGSYSDYTVSVKATINAVASVESGLKLYVALVENNTFGNTGTNGETDFYNVLMQMLPDAEGTTLNALESGKSEVISLSFNMINTFVEDMNDLSAVVFVQDDTTKQVLQSTSIPIELIDNINENASILNTIYPNPFSNSITVDNLQIGSKIGIINIMGQTIMSVTNTVGKQQINTANFTPGIYVITITDAANNAYVKKIVKQ